MWALVPLKLLANAKQRLAGTLSPEQRAQLVLAMASDVLRALHESQRIEHILLISRNTEAQPLAQRYSAELFLESASTNLPGALTEGARYAKDQGAEGICIIPADAPLVTAADLDLLISSHSVCTVVPDQQLVGTNALVLSPPDAIAPIFDGRSFAPHVNACVAQALPVRVVCSRRLGLDIDTPEDLIQLRNSTVATDSKRYLASVD